MNGDEVAKEDDAEVVVAVRAKTKHVASESSKEVSHKPSEMNFRRTKKHSTTAVEASQFLQAMRDSDD